MVRLCTCTRGSTSTIRSSKKQAATASCKTCGGKTAIDGKGSSSGSMLSTVLELTSILNSDLTWTKVPKGHRSSSRRPRRLNTIHLAGEELPTKDLKGLEMSISESEKLGASVLGCHFRERTEHMPIKKRRFLFRSPSPPNNTASPSSEGTKRRATCLDSSRQELQPNLNATCQPSASSPVPELVESSIRDSKVEENKLVKDSKKTIKDEDFSGISIPAAAACSNSLGGDADRGEGSEIFSSCANNLESPRAVELKENSVKPIDMPVEDTDSHLSTAPSKDVASSTTDLSTFDNSSPDEPILDDSFSQVPSDSECSRMNTKTNKTQKSAARDDRFHWDLNTVMDAWEEPVEREHEISASGAACINIACADEEGKRNGNEGNARRRKLGQECGSPSENIGSRILPVDLKILGHVVEESKLEECKPDGCPDIIKLLSPAIDNVPPDEVDKTKSLHNEHLYSCADAIPVAVPSTLTLEYPTCGISSKHASLNHKSTSDLALSGDAGTDLSVECPIPPGFNHWVNMRGSKENVDVTSTTIDSGNNVDHAITAIETISEHEKQNLSLTTVTSLENEAHESRVTFNEEDEAGVKKAMSSNQITAKYLGSKGSDLTQETDKGDSKAENQTIFGSLLVTQSSVAAEVEDQHAAVSSNYDAEVPINAERLPLTATSGKSMMLLSGTIYHKSHESHPDYSSDLVSYDKETCEVPLDNDFGYGNFQSDIQDGSGFGKVNEMPVGHDSQYEDGELREGNKGKDRENEHSTDKGTSFNLATFDAHENNSQCVPEDSSTVLLPEKLDGSDQVSGSRPNETRNNTRQNSIEDATRLNQWKMNISGGDLLPESHIPSSDITKIRDLNSIKFSRIRRYGSETEDVETKTEGSRFYRREPPSRRGGPSTRDAFLNRSRFHAQECRSERKLGALRSLRRGKYSPHNQTNNRGDDRSFRRRLPMNSEEDIFRARLGLRPSGDTNHNRLGRSLRYGSTSTSRHNGGGPTGRYDGPSIDDHDEPLIEYSHPFSTRPQCFSPSRSRTHLPINNRFRRSRSPNLRSDARMRHDSPPVNSRWVNYKQQSVFDRSPPPCEERFSLYDSSRKTTQNGNYRADYMGNDGDQMDHKYRRGGFLRRYDMGRPVKHLRYDDEDDYGSVYDSCDKDALEFHGEGRGNPKPYSNVTDSRFHDLPRRPREERDPCMDQR